MPSRKCEDRPHLGPAKPIKGTIVDMSRFVNLGNHDPYRLFAAVLARSRRGMEEAFYAAFAADARCSQLMKEEQLLSISITPTAIGATAVETPVARALEYGAMSEERTSLRVAAQAEDLIVVLWADNILQRLARGVLGKRSNSSDGYGPRYGSAQDPVPFTSMLRAATNTLRHVSEWDDNEELCFPYEESTATSFNAKMAIQNIRILSRVFGLCKNERIRDVVSWRLLVAVDGKLGTQPPDYRRFEKAVLAAAREIAAAAGDESIHRLEVEIHQNEYIDANQ
jgi:hypothetical protein